MKLHIFNPENDLALADGGANYCPPPAAASIADDLCTLPLWFASPDDAVLLKEKVHIDYCSEMQEQFTVARPFSSDMLNSIEECVPWGWSSQMLRRLESMGIQNKNLPEKRFIEKIRDTSNRRTSIKILQELAERGVDIPPLPIYNENISDVKSFIESMPRSVVKAPWSGSGKGLLWGIGRVEVPMERFCNGIIKRQGGVICEHFFKSIIEFAMEFLADCNSVTFSGYSLFSTSNGAYTGNILAPDSEIEEFLSGFIHPEELSSVRMALCDVLRHIIGDTGYAGYMGVDMMLYEDNNSKTRLHPCIELNFRMNMGMLSRILYDRHVHSGKRGIYKVEYFKNNNDAVAAHRYMKEKNPLAVCDRKIVSGYINLSPVTTESHYIAYVEISDDNLCSLYTRHKI